MGGEDAYKDMSGEKCQKDIDVEVKLGLADGSGKGLVSDAVGS